MTLAWRDGFQTLASRCWHNGPKNWGKCFYGRIMSSKLNPPSICGILSHVSQSGPIWVRHFDEKLTRHIIQISCILSKPILQNKVGRRTQKQYGAQHVFFEKILWCGQLCSARNRSKIFTETSCALMVSGATIHHSMLCQLRLHSSSRYSANVFNSIPSSYSLFIPGFLFSLLRCSGSEDEAWTDRTPCDMKTKRRRELTKRASKRRYEDDRW